MAQAHESDSSVRIAFVLETISTGVDADEALAFQSIAGTDAANKAVQYAREGNHEQYYYALQYPLEKALRGLLNEALPEKRKAQFIFEHQKFVAAHFKEVIARREGNACCADKTRTILRKLLRYYISGQKIILDGPDFALPEKVFTTHDEIVEFFLGLEALYFGKPERYLAALSRALGAP